MNYGNKSMKKAKNGMYNMGGSVVNSNYSPVAADMQRQNMQMGKGMNMGGLTKAPNKGAASLPKAVRNKMGYMNKGGLMCGASNPPSKKRT